MCLRATPALVTLLALCSVVMVGDARADDWHPSDEVIIRLKPGGNINNITSAWNATVVDSVAGHRIYLLHLNNPAVQDSMTMELDDGPESGYCDYNTSGENAEARRQIVVIAIGDSTSVHDQEAYLRVNVPLAHAFTRGAGARVAMLDAGVDLAHPLLVGHFDMASAYDFVDDDGDPSDTSNGLDDDGDTAVDEGVGHGNMVAGILASIAPEATLIPLRVLDDEGRGSAFAVLQGIYRAYDMGAHVVNASLGTLNSVEAIGNALEEMDVLGMPIVAAGGNDAVSTLQFPAAYSEAIAVTALDSVDIKAAFANWSSDVDVSAPGVGVFSAYRNGGFGQGEGTSFAAPFISGTMALLRSRFPRYSAAAHRTMIENTAIPVQDLPGNQMWQGDLGRGRVDCYRAIVYGFGPTQVEDPVARPGAFRTLIVPDPARASTSVRFTLPAAATVAIDVITADGRRVRSLPLGRRGPGAQSATIGLDDLPAGRYLLAVRASLEDESREILDTTPLTVTR